MDNSRMTRRSFLTLPALAPLAIWRPAFVTGSPAVVHHFQYDHVIGTSMDLSVWTPSHALAERADEAVRDEIHRLSSVLNTRDSRSDIRLLGENASPERNSDLDRVFSAYSHWERRTRGLLSIRPAGPASPRNVDALGKAYIIDRAVQATRSAVPDLDGLLLNIGGDIVIWGRSCEIDVTDPRSPYDNAQPLTRIVLSNSAVATSGVYARGQHLIDGRTGQVSTSRTSATVVASDAVTANALATTLCLSSVEEGMKLVDSTPGAAALRIDAGGMEWRSTGFAQLERRPLVRRVVLADWPAGYQLTVSFTLTEGSAPQGRGGFGRGGPGRGPGGRGGAKRPYVAIWVEDASRKVVRVLAFWADKPRYFPELSTFYTGMGRNQNRLANVARATRAPGSYQLVWDGLDDAGDPAPAGSYTVIVETNQEHGGYGRQKASIDCGTSMPADLMLSTTPNAEAISVHYGPKSTQA